MAGSHRPAETRIRGATAIASSWYTDPVRFAIAWWWIPCWILVVHRAVAAPTITVQGRTALRILATERSAGGWVTIAGDLRDAQLATGISGQRVELRVAVAGRVLRAAAVTDRHGVFRARLRLPLGAHTLEARFAGDRVRAPAALGPVELDVSKGSLVLELRLAELLDAAQPEQRVELSARAAGAPASVEVKLGTDGQPALATLRTGGDGRGAVTIPTAALGPPGPVTLVARFAGDGALNPASARWYGTLVTTVTLDLAPARAQVAADATIGLSGTARDLRGPVRGGTVALSAMGKHRATARTDASGGFRFAIPASAYPPGPLDLEVRYFPAVLWRRAGEPRSVTVEVLAARPIPMAIYAIPALITGLLFAAAACAKILPRLRARLRREPAPDAPDEPAAAREVRGGLELSRKRLRALLVHDTGISGVVIDALDDTPLGGAVLRMQREGGVETMLVTGDRGRFAVEDLVPGAYRIAVEQPGYVTERFGVQLPHRGGYRNVRVRLVPVRVRVLEIYRDVALPLLPRPELWARWTPRELLGSLGTRRSRWRALAQLSTLLEDVYWGPDVPPQEALRRARELAASVRGDAGDPA